MIGQDSRHAYSCSMSRLFRILVADEGGDESASGTSVGRGSRSRVTNKSLNSISGDEDCKLAHSLRFTLVASYLEAEEQEMKPKSG